MQQKPLIALLAVTAFALVLAAFAVLGNGGPFADPLVGTPVLPEVAPNLAAITRVSLVRGDVATTLIRDGEAWAVAERGNYPADAQKLRALLLGLAELTYVEPKTKQPQSYPRLQIEDAGDKDAKSTLITITDAKSSLLGEVIAGKRRVDQLGGGDDGVYLRKPGNAQSWLARGTLDVSGDTASWLDQKLFDLPAAGVKEVVLAAPDGSRLTITRDKPEDKFRLVELAKDKKLKSDDALAAPAAALAGFTLSDVKLAAGANFPSDGVSHARFAMFNGLTVTIDLTDQDKVSWARIVASGSGDAAATAQGLNSRLAPWVFALPQYEADLLKTRLATLLAPPKAS
ncbi:MAG TPA: DUF4340 domain-containing protein [Stellaceae bacterium]|jgi:hypothetical protein|nr:DUF4340 domain-containing protein [Stellaceae bacterium]